MDEYLGLIEMALFFGITFGLIAWQFWSLRRANRIADEQKCRDASKPQSSSREP